MSVELPKAVNEQMRAAIISMAVVIAVLVVVATAGATDRVAPVSGTTHPKLQSNPPPKLKTCSDGGFVATASYAGRMTSPDSRLNGKLRLVLHESASKADDAVVTATGTLRRHGRRSKVTLYGTDHRNDFDGVMIVQLRRDVILVANLSQHQNADGTADGEFGAGGTTTPQNTAVVARTHC